MLSSVLYAVILASPAHAAPITLADAWEAAGANSREMKLISELKLQNDTLKTQAFALLGPKLVLGGNYTLNQRETVIDFGASFPPDMLALIEQFTGAPVDLGDPLVVNKKSYVDWNVSVIQPIFSGQALPLFKGAIATVKAGRATEQQQLSKVRAGVAQAYWGVFVARAAEQLAKDAVTNAQKHQSQAEVRVSAGTAAPQLGLQAQIAVARADRELAGAEAQRASAEVAFANLTGLKPDVELVEPTASRIPYATREEALSAAVTQRGDIQAADFQTVAARAQQTGTALTWLPTVDGRFTQAYTQNSGFSGEPYNWQFVIKADWVLWDGGARIAEQARTASVVRMAETAADKAAADANAEVITLWEQHQRAIRAVAAVDRELALATENARLADASFSAGVLAFLDLEDARLGLNAARLTQLLERMNLDVSAIHLLAATGDLN